jgi:galactitol-specific phosphotransferase system IIB component
MEIMKIPPVCGSGFCSKSISATKIDQALKNPF